MEATSKTIAALIGAFEERYTADGAFSVTIELTAAWQNAIKLEALPSTDQAKEAA